MNKIFFCPCCGVEVIPRGAILVREDTVKVMGNKLEEQVHHYIHADCYLGLRSLSKLLKTNNQKF